MVSLLKAWWGDAATARERLLLRLPAAHRRRPLPLRDDAQDARRRRARACSASGRIRPSARPTRKLMRLALAKLEWLVVRDFQPTESALFWKDSPEHESGEVRAEDIQTEVFFLPAPRTPRRTATSPTRSGCCSGTGRRSSRPATRARSFTGSTTCAGRSAEKLAGSTEAAGPSDPRLDLGLPAPGTARRARRAGRAPGDQRQRPRRAASLTTTSSRTTGRRLRLLDPRRHLQGRRQPVGAQAAGPGTELDRASSGAGRGPRTSGSSTTGPRPTPTASRGPSASGTCGGTPRRRSGPASGTRRTSRRPRRRTSSPKTMPRRSRRSAGDKPFILHPDGRGWLYAPSGLVDGPLPDALRARGEPVRESALPPAAESHPTGVPAARESLPPPGAHRCSRMCSPPIG